MKHKHDCSECVFLFSKRISTNLYTHRKQNINKRWYDVYYCTNEKTFIFRYGNEHRYNSVPLNLIKTVEINNSFSNDRKKMYDRAYKKAIKIRVIT